MTKLARGLSIPFPETPGLPVRPAYVELPETGFEEPLTGLKKETLELVHRFARDVMRPQGTLLDRLTPEQMIAKGSPYWSVIEKHKELGLSALANADLSPPDAVDLQAMISEELGWGTPVSPYQSAVEVSPETWLPAGGGPTCSKPSRNRFWEAGVLPSRWPDRTCWIGNAMPRIRRVLTNDPP